MLSEKEKRRSCRLLKMMLGEKCTVHSSTMSGHAILKIAGVRTLKCDSRIIQSWIVSDLVSIMQRSKEEFDITVTQNGKQSLDRSELKDFAAQHRNLTTENIKFDDQVITVTKNLRESPLAKLYKPVKGQKIGWLDDDEFNAGERLRSDFEFANMGPRITASWDPTAHLSSNKGGRRPTETVSERAMAARSRLNKAIEIVGPELSGVLLDTCCYLKGLEQIEMERRWPRRSAKLILKAALAVLARHYAPPEKSSKSTMRSWGAQGYRPTIG